MYFPTDQKKQQENDIVLIPRRFVLEKIMHDEEKTKEYLKSLGVILLNSAQLQTVTAEYTRQVLDCLHGKQSSLLMLPTFLPLPPKKIQKEKHVLVVEIG